MRLVVPEGHEHEGSGATRRVRQTQRQDLSRHTVRQEMDAGMNRFGDAGSGPLPSAEEEQREDAPGGLAGPERAPRRHAAPPELLRRPCKTRSDRAVAITWAEAARDWDGALTAQVSVDGTRPFHT